MEAIIALLLIYFICYLIFIGVLSFGFAKVKTTKGKTAVAKTTFSIIIPVRNEAENLPMMLESIRKLNYPKELFELILVDDFSEDASASLIYKWRMANGEFHVTLLESVRITGSPKKDAIARAVPIVVNDWIITTDADCMFPENWLATLNDCILEHDADMIAGAVAYRDTRSFLGNFQNMDLTSLQGATIGSFGLGKAFICNGANFTYKKSLYNELKGFEGNSQIASGDDVFLLQKAMVKCPEKVHYLKSNDNIVSTKPVETWKMLFYQRVRWASKTIAYESDFGELLAWVIFLGNCCVIGLAVIAALGFLRIDYFLYLFLFKFLVDYVLLLQANRFLNKGKFIFPILSSILYPFFSVAVAVYSIFGSYEWKGRKFR